MAFGKSTLDVAAFKAAVDARLEGLSDGNVILQLGNVGKPKPLRLFCTKCEATKQLPSLEMFTDDAEEEDETLLDKETSWAKTHKHPPVVQTGPITPVDYAPVTLESNRKLKVVI